MWVKHLKPNKLKGKHLISLILRLNKITYAIQTFYVTLMKVQVVPNRCCDDIRSLSGEAKSGSLFFQKEKFMTALMWMRIIAHSSLNHQFIQSFDTWGKFWMT